MYTINTNSLKVSEYQRLKGTTNWENLKDDQVEVALHHNLYSVVIYHKDKAIGMGRVIGDGAIYFYIQDVIVSPNYRGKGVGSLLMHHIDKFLKDTILEYAFIGLMAAPGTSDFYSKLQFHRRRDNAPGMYQILKRE